MIVTPVHRYQATSPLKLMMGHPTKNIRDIRNITTVIKDGKVYDPAAIEKALGIVPRHTGP